MKIIYKKNEVEITEENNKIILSNNQLKEIRKNIKHNEKVGH
jgi:hypothetical protein